MVSNQSQDVSGMHGEGKKRNGREGGRKEEGKNKGPDWEGDVILEARVDRVLRRQSSRVWERPPCAAGHMHPETAWPVHKFSSHSAKATRPCGCGIWSTWPPGKRETEDVPQHLPATAQK